MFQNPQANSNGYTKTSKEGTDYLRNQIRTKLYDGNGPMTDKLTNYQLFWKFYNNQHWAENNDQLLSFNYVRAVIDKVVNFMIGDEGFSFAISDTYGDELVAEMERAFSSLVNYNWRKNKKMVFIHNLLQMGSVCGDAYVFVGLDEKSRYVEYTLLDSRIVVPKFENGDWTKIESYRVVKVLSDNDKKYIQEVTEYKKGSVTSYYQREAKEGAQQFEWREEKNDLDFIPIVHIENIPMSDSYGGKSDIHDIVKINKIYNEMSEDIKSIIDYYASPTTVITGGTMGQLKRGAGEIWSGLPEGANVFNLGLGEDLSASTNFLTILKNSIHDLSGVPEEILSKVPHISNTSSAALRMLYQALIQIANRKAVSYGEGLERLNQMTCLFYATTELKEHPLYKRLEKYITAEMAATSDMEETDFFDRYISSIVWKYALPNDMLGMLQEMQIEDGLGIGSRKEWMARMGKKNVQLILDQVDLDDERKVELEQAKQPVKDEIPAPGPGKEKPEAKEPATEK